MYKIGFMREKREIDFSYQGSAEVWVADFGSHGVAEDIDNEVTKMKIKRPKRISWIFLSILVFLVVVILEYYLNKLVNNLDWSSMAILWATWFWRFGLILLWLFISRVQFLLDYKKIIAVSFLSFVGAALFSAISKIVFVRTLWPWLNLFVEPIWMALLVLLSLALFYKIKK